MLLSACNLLDKHRIFGVEPWWKRRNFRPSLAKSVTQDAMRGFWYSPPFAAVHLIRPITSKSLAISAIKNILKLNDHSCSWHYMWLNAARYARSTREQPLRKLSFPNIGFGKDLFYPPANSTSSLKYLVIHTSCNKCKLRNDLHNKWNQPDVYFLCLSNLLSLLWNLLIIKSYFFPSSHMPHY